MPYPLDHDAFLALMTYRCRKSAETHKKLPPLKPILALPTWGQKCPQTELQSFEIGNFDLGHPVPFFSRLTCFDKSSSIVATKFVITYPKKEF